MFQKILSVIMLSLTLSSAAMAIEKVELKGGESILLGSVQVSCKAPTTPQSYCICRMNGRNGLFSIYQIEPSSRESELASGYSTIDSCASRIEQLSICRH